jgi:site-specific DNA recombinase
MTYRVYYRVSTDKQDFEMQEEAIQKVCNGNNINYNSCILYQDYGLSGTTDQRPEYQRLLAEVEEYDLILVYEFSRLWRDIGE